MEHVISLLKPMLYTFKWSATNSLGNSLHSSTPWNMTQKLSKPQQSDLQIDESQNRSWIQNILHVDIDVISRKNSVCMLGSLLVSVGVCVCVAAILLL